MTLAIAQAREQWAPEGVYLNTASFGLPPRCAWDALQAALSDWRAGRTSWEGWGDETQRAREAWAALVGVPAAWVATGSVVSAMVGIVAASLPDGSRVLAPDIEFTSNLWPFAAQGRGITVTTVPAADLAEAIDARTDVVAFSAAHSATGEIADLDAVIAAAEHHGALTVCDGTQAVGWLPLDAARLDVLTCSAYKWLLSPRGSAFMSVRPSLLDRLLPQAAGWFAGADIHSSYYGMPLRLADDARRLDVSPAWFSWVGTTPALELLGEIGVETIQAHDVALANRLRAGLGLEPSNSAIVSADVPGAADRLAGTEVRAATRAGALRASFHVYNTAADVDRVLELLTA